MFIGLLQFRHSLQEHSRLYLFAVFVLLTWAIWLLKVALSRRYRPWTDEYDATTTVIVPVVDEPLDLFREVLRRIVAQSPTQTVVVINGKRNVDLEAVCTEFVGNVEWLWTPIAGKRNAVRMGVEHTRGEIAVLVDSDTLWTDGTLSELRKPFAEPGVGGVSTRQRILEPRRNFLTRWADWLENSRALYAMPAQSVLGTVGCLPGRTIAFRTSVLQRTMREFMSGRFLGVFLEVSDDRTLTNLTLRQGLRTVYQSTSLVYTDAPTGLRKLIKQQLRWARGSQYNTLRMLPWMLGHAPVLAFFFLADIVLPFLWVASVTAWVIRSVRHTGDNFYGGILAVHQHALVIIVLLTVLASTLSMCLRQIRHISEVPSDALWMPVYIVFSTLVLMPVRIFGFLRLGHVGGWGTRADAFTVEQAHERRDDPGELTAGAATAPTVTAEPSHVERAVGGDPRGLLPYLIAGAVLFLGVLYDVLPT